MRTDAELQQDVIRNIRSDIYLAGSKITVFVVRGAVCLYGQVSSRFKHTLVQKTVSHIEGVRRIEDHLIVQDSLFGRNHHSNPYAID